MPLTLDRTDFLEYLAHDDETKIIALYLEGVRDGSKLLRQIKEINRRKPVIIMKGGLTESGARTVGSHTGSLAGGEHIWEAVFRQSGAVKVTSLEEMTDVILAFLHLGAPQGRRVGVYYDPSRYTEYKNEGGRNQIPAGTEPRYIQRGSVLSIIGATQAQIARPDTVDALLAEVYANPRLFGFEPATTARPANFYEGEFVEDVEDFMPPCMSTGSCAESYWVYNHVENKWRRRSFLAGTTTSATSQGGATWIVRDSSRVRDSDRETHLPSQYGADVWWSVVPGRGLFGRHASAHHRHHHRHAWGRRVVPTSAVTVEWSVLDDESAISVQTGCETTTLTADTGGTTLTCSATSAGGSSSKSVMIKIDATPPSFSCGMSPAIITPPNHKLVNAVVTVIVSDTGSGPGSFSLLSAISSEADSGTDSKDLPNDVQGWTSGTADLSGLLRAERSEAGPGRTYTLGYRGFDAAGNSSDCTATAFVPHDQKK